MEILIAREPIDKETLSGALSKIGEAMAKASEQPAGAGSTPPPSDGGGQGPDTPPATDAEFKEKT